MTEFEVMKEALLREYGETQVIVHDYEGYKEIDIPRFDLEFNFTGEGKFDYIVNNRYSGY